MTMATWQSMNYEQSTPDLTQPFSIICPNQTDIWDKPPSTHRFNAPLIYTTTTVGAFKSAAVTIDGKEFVYQYDQGGLCLVINLPDGNRKWLKAGIEQLDGRVMVSVVAKDRWADWSLRPPFTSHSSKVRIAIEPHDDKALWVFAVDDDGTRHPLREVTWWGELEDDTPILIGPAAARPSKDPGDLLVDFDDFVLEKA